MNRTSRKILLPFAKDSKGDEIHISDAVKGEKYFCPVCGEELVLRISKIPEGQKGYRKNHFAHKSGNTNTCSESYLHKRTKQKIVDLINDRLNQGVNELKFRWHCDKCGEYHEGNLLKKAAKVVEEYNLTECIPDIALLDKDDNVVIVIEVVVTHEPSENALNYYENHKIACLQLMISDFDDCEDISKRLLSVDKVNICPNPLCPKCHRRMNRAEMFFIDKPCWKCGNSVRLALIGSPQGMYVNSTGFNGAEIALANQYGANIHEVKTKRGTLECQTVCKACKSYNFASFNYDQLFEPETRIVNLGFKCFDCVYKEKPYSWFSYSRRFLDL